MQLPDRIVELRRVRAGDLVPDELNWRTHPDEQREALQGVLAEIGLADACLTRELPDGRLALIDGHLRASLDPEQILPCLVLDLDEEEAHKLLLTLDPLAGLAGVNTLALQALAAEVTFDSAAVQALVTGMVSSNPVDEPVIPGQDAEPEEPPANPISRPGDLWLLDSHKKPSVSHKLFCGDSSNPAHVAALFDGEQWGLCFTSPPYGAGANAHYKPNYYAKGKTLYTHDKDDMTSDQWVAFCNQWMNAAAEHRLDDLSPMVVNVMYNANNRDGYGRVMFAGSHPFKVHETICWDKQNGFPSASRGILSRNWELIFVLSTGEKYFSTQGDNEVRWAKWDISRPQQVSHISAAFPLDLALKAVTDFSNLGAIVFEPFSGSGTVLLAGTQTGRSVRACEIYPAYCDVALLRWQQFTGCDAVLAATGQTYSEVSVARES